VTGAWFNVIMCGVLGVACPVLALSWGQDVAHIVFAVFVFGIAIALEVHFIRALREEIARRSSR
jgi:hypothetical protein